MEDLGYANGWDKTPEIIKECEQKGHREEVRNVGRCLTEYSCAICGYKYTIDSGD